MRQFSIKVHSYAEIQAFVSLAIAQPFDVLIGNSSQSTNAKSLMGILALNFRRPLTVSVNCAEEDFLRFYRQAAPFIVASF